MDMQSWKSGLVMKAVKQITYKTNMSNSDINSLTNVLSDYLDEGINILRKWRKLKDDTEFVSGMHDSGLIVFIKSKEQANGRDLFTGYSSGGITATMKVSPENVLKSTCKQVM
jgi:hypothetical protein